MHLGYGSGTHLPREKKRERNVLIVLWQGGQKFSVTLGNENMVVWIRKRDWIKQLAENSVCVFGFFGVKLITEASREKQGQREGLALFHHPRPPCTIRSVAPLTPRASVEWNEFRQTVLNQHALQIWQKSEKKNEKKNNKDVVNDDNSRHA